MALRLKTDYQGIDADYWKIVNMRVDYRSQTSILDLALYFSEDTRRENIKNVLLIKQFVFHSLDMDRQEQYNQIKAPVLNEKKGNTNVFAEAEDC